MIDEANDIGGGGRPTFDARSGLIELEFPRDGSSSVGEALERIRRESRDESEKGRWFENLVGRVFTTSPEYEISEVHRWAEWPEREELTGRDGRDRGIDLVARHRDGGWIAIQCKCYADDARVSKPDIDSFLGYTQQAVFSMRWIVATCDWTTAAEVAIEGASPPIHRIDFLRHADDLVLELDTERPIRSLWPRQREAVDKVVKGLHHNDRGRLTMACGTGKTFTSLRIAEQVVPDGGNIVFLAPSIALVSQARREWLRHTSRPLECAVVCSDSSAGGRGEQADVRLSELECAVSSDPAELADLLSVESRNDVTRVVFCTYQSLKHLTAAQDQLGAPTFDLALCDEAHRTTGVDRGASGGLTSGFQAVHRDESLRADKRLYMTATPRIYSHRSRSSLASKGIETVDMSDLNVYGPELELLSFKEAVNDGLLSDYRVIVLGVHENAIPSGMRNRLVSLGERLSEEKTKPLIITEDEMMRLLGTSLAVNGLAEGDDLDRPGRLHRTIAFANSILRSKFFAEGLRQPELKSLITRRTRHSDPGATESLRIDVQHLDGTDSALKRNKALRELGQAGEEDIARVLCNVRLFGEGVDVPSLDAIVFMEPRDSQIDIVQAVGRVMRRSKGKRLGYIVVPVPIAPGSDLATALSEGNSGYEALGQVLRALQSHDGRLAENPLHYVQAHEIQRTPTEEPEQTDTASSQLVLDLREAGQGIYAHVVASSGLGTPGLLVADDIALAVRAAARLFEEGELAGPLANAMGLATPENDRDVCTIAALLVQNACLLHRRLCDVPRMNWLSDLATVSGDESPAVALRRDWEKILELDYKPVFEPALAVLDALPPRRFAYHALCRLAECANRTAASLSDMGYDHAGPLYHRILPNAEATGAFYTNNLSALLLARLAIDSEFSDWADGGQVRDLRIMDPACGTGTLLMAALHVLKSRCKEAHGLASEEQAELHQALVENVLCGLDINRHATQLAACNLTLGAPTVDYQQINLFTLRHGPQPDGMMQAGSLELLSTAASADSLHSLVRPLRTQQGIGAVQVNDTELDFALQDLDLVIMNPPFTNNTKRHRQYTDEQVQQMQQHELRIRDHLAMSDPAAGDVIDSNSIRTFFTPLADQLLNPESGVLAEVLPVTATIGAAGKSERRFLASRFHIERIITSHDPKRINFSENTSIHECLLIARRGNPPPPPPQNSSRYGRCQRPQRRPLPLPMPSPAENLPSGEAARSGQQIALRAGIGRRSSGSTDAWPRRPTRSTRRQDLSQWAGTMTSDQRGREFGMPIRNANHKTRQECRSFGQSAPRSTTPCEAGPRRMASRKWVNRPWPISTGNTGAASSWLKNTTP